jgi:arylsulfatase A-like enzyme
MTRIFAICLAWVALASAAAERPNIVFFFADDQTSSSLGCYGHPIVQTPNLDSLASRGTLFRNSFVSQPICWVSRSTILTGLVGRSFGAPGNPEQISEQAVKQFYTDQLREAGYRTGHYGKWHAKLPKGEKPESHFDEFEAIGRNPFFKRMPDGSFRHETDLIVDRGIEFVKSQPEGKPFALNLWFNACHAEDKDRRPGPHFAWPQSANGLYEEQEVYRPRLDDPAIFEALPPFFKTSITRERYFWRWNTPSKYETNMRSYLRMVTGIDNAIGRFLEVLEETALAENTIVVYSADNGYHMANRGLAGKWSHFEESIRVPLIIADPRVEASQQGQVTDAMALNLDFPSTFLDWAGVAIPDTYQGRSLRPVVEKGKPGDWRDETYHEHYAVRTRIPAWEGIRTERFKYSRYFDNGDFEFLYDLQADPDELTNLAENPKHQETLESMRARTTERVAEYGGPLADPTQPFTRSTDPHPVASAKNASPPGKDGFSRPFDGKSLRGWDGDPKYWSVKDGALTGVTDGSLKMNRFITWIGSTVRNFDLRVKVKVSEGGNSGLQYRGQSRIDLGLDVVTGYQCDVVAAKPEYNGMLYEEKGRRILSHTGEIVVVDPEGQPWVVGKVPVKKFAPEEWHEYRVLVKGNHHRHWIDGHKTADLIDLDEEGRSLDGVLAVQVHVGPAMTIQFKDWRIRHLPDDLPLLTAEEVDIPPEAYGVKPQGKLPKGWKAPIYGEQ